MTDRQYVYKITEVVKVTDGDTYWLRCDVGFRQNILINVRLHGYDCPETNRGSDNEKQKAKEARRCAESFFQGNRNGHLIEVGGFNVGTFWIQTKKDPDNFGRWLGDIWLEMADQDIHLGEWLHKQELASAWPTRWREEFDK